jgi:HAD superfamily hydrolase (TIGR01509 family)
VSGPREQTGVDHVQLPSEIGVCLFDLDGVLTATATLHAAAWKTTFDEFLAHRAAADGDTWVPFDLSLDYRRYVDGKLREEGVRSFLRSRNIVLSEGSPNDAPGTPTVSGLAEAKNQRVLKEIAVRGIEVFPGSVRFVRSVRCTGRPTGVVSASANTVAVLDAANLTSFFDVVIDGQFAQSHGLDGKPHPDTYLAAAAAFSTPPEHAAIFDDALSGIDAGRAGAFGLVVGVDRDDDTDEMYRHGAHRVVHDLAELLDKP